MKKTTCLLSLVFIIAVSCNTSFAADKDKLMNEINTVRTSINSLSQSGDDTSAFLGDLATAANYLKLAETEIDNNKSLLGLLGTVKDDAVPTIHHYTEMADITVAIVRSKIKKMKYDTETARLEKLILVAKAENKMLDDKNAEIEQLKAENEKLRASSAGMQKSDEELKAKNKMLDERNAEIERLKAENEKLKTASQKTEKETK